MTLEKDPSTNSIIIEWDRGMFNDHDFYGVIYIDDVEHLEPIGFGKAITVVYEASVGGLYVRHTLNTKG